MDTFRKFVKFLCVQLLIGSSIILTPFRLIFELFTVTHPDLFRGKNTPEVHDDKVRSVQDQVRKWNKKGRKGRMCTGRPGWQTLSLRVLDKSKMTKIYIDMDDIIEIDEDKKILRVEPGMKMGTLTYKLLRLGWTIPVVPEFESLTVGGLVNGLGVETSSHKYGFFADSCLEFEVVLGDGSKISCSKKENSDIFYAIPMSHGSIGLLTGVTIPLIPAQRYVKVEYFPSHSVKETEILLQKIGYDFIEGLQFDQHRAVVMYGTFVETAESDKINYVNRWYKPFFYAQVKNFLNSEKPKMVEYIPLRDYYHRHQRGYFWEWSSISSIWNNPVWMFLFGWIHPLNFQLQKLVVPLSLWDLVYSKDDHVLQDFEIPMTKLDEFIQLSHDEVEVYPLWLCPTKLLNQPGLMHTVGSKDEIYVDVGIYGDAKKNHSGLQKAIQKFENFCMENRGFQFLYADSYLSKEEFAKMFDTKNYDKIRKSLKSEDAFPHVYDKISLQARNAC